MSSRLVGLDPVDLAVVVEAITACYCCEDNCFDSYCNSYCCLLLLFFSSILFSIYSSLLFLFPLFSLSFLRIIAGNYDILTLLPASGVLLALSPGMFFKLTISLVN